MRAWTRLRSRRGGATEATSAGRDVLKWVAAAFALVATATAEYEIARAIGMNEYVAAAVPGALDAYVVRALIRHREVLTAVLAMVAVNAASHLVTAGILPVEWPLITAVSAIAPLVLWRVHALGTPGDWRARKLWDLTKDEYAAVHASTEAACPACLHEHTGPCTHFAGTSGACTCEHTEHDRAPDNPEPPGTREHPEGCTWGHAECAGWNACTVYSPVRATQHAASTDDLDVPDWVNPPITPPENAPYVDHVLLPDLPSAQPMPARHLEIVRGLQMPGTEEHEPDPVCPACKHDAHVALACARRACDCVHHLPGTGEPDPEDWVDPDREHTASTRTAEDWNREHVSTGVLEPTDTEHMERARELFHTIGGVPPFRALKEGTPGMGTPRAERIRAALKIEAEGTD